MKNTLKVLALSSVLLFSLSCEKDKKTDPAPVEETPAVVSGETGSMKVQFNNNVDGAALELNKSYTNQKGEPYTVTKFNYYISNIVLTKNDNTVIHVPNVYQIIKQSDESSRTIELKGITAGSYKSVKIMLGVDSTSNCSGAHSGGLDFTYAADMFWGWNQGYIFFKLEGKFGAQRDSSFSYHIGGFGGKYKTQKEFVINLPAEQIAISTNSTPTLNLSVNVNEVFKNPEVISISKYNSVLSPGTTDTKRIADNYADMIQFESIKK